MDGHIRKNGMIRDPTTVVFGSRVGIWVFTCQKGYETKWKNGTEKIQLVHVRTEPPYPQKTVWRTKCPCGPLAKPKTSINESQLRPLLWRPFDVKLISLHAQKYLWMCFGYPFDIHDFFCMSNDILIPSIWHPWFSYLSLLFTKNVLWTLKLKKNIPH